MRILITGANGFIGSHLAAWLAAAGHNIVASARNAGRARHRYPQYHWIEADYRSEFALLAVVPAETDAEAAAKLADYQSYGIREGGLALISGWTGLDMADFDTHACIEHHESEGIRAMASSLCARSVDEWAEYLMVGGAAPVIAGSPKTVADEMEAWMDETGIDGFNLAYTVMPECVTEFVDLVVPELQRRGRYKTAYTPGSMREMLFGAGSRLKASHPGSRYQVKPGDLKGQAA